MVSLLTPMSTTLRTEFKALQRSQNTAGVQTIVIPINFLMVNFNQ